MEEKVNVWKANLTNGLILGLAGIAFSLILWFLDLSLNKSVGYLNIPIQLILLYFLLKSYRDNFMHGQITYGQSLGAGVVIFVYYSIIAAIFGYLLFTVIDPGLVAKIAAQAEEGLRSKGNMSDEQIETAMKFTKKIMSPGIMSAFGMLGSMFGGLIMSLIVSIFIKKEGNPLVDSVDTPSN